MASAMAGNACPVDVGTQPHQQLGRQVLRVGGRAAVAAQQQLAAAQQGLINHPGCCGDRLRLSPCNLLLEARRVFQRAPHARRQIGRFVAAWFNQKIVSVRHRSP